MPRPTSRRSTGAAAAVRATVEQLGDFELTLERFDALGEAILASAAVRKIREAASGPVAFRALVFDYSNNRTLICRGRLATPRQVTVVESRMQPVPTVEEFDEAVGRLRKDPELGAAVRDGRLQPYAPMPPLVGDELPDGRRERVVAVGLLPRDRGVAHEIVGVDLGDRRVVRFERRAPRDALAAPSTCGIPFQQQATTSNAAGRVRITVRRRGKVLWRFHAVRPAASSGTNGSGVELRYVDYGGRRVLYRAVKW